MSKTIGRFLKPLTASLRPYIHTYRWLGLPSEVISANNYPNQLIYPAYSYLYEPPLGVDKPKELTRRLFSSIEARVWKFPRGMATCRASHYDREARLLWELSEQFRFVNPQEHPDLDFKLRRCLERVHEVPLSLVSLTIDGPRNIYHWYYDALPRLHLLERAGIPMEALYADASRPFVKESLEMCSIEPRYFFDASKIKAICAKELIVPSFMLYGGRSFKPAAPLWSLHWLRHKLLSKVKPRAYKRIFISREDATYRFLKEEDRHFERLKKEGFERFKLSGMPLKEQAALFAGADIIVSAHGAGLAHLLYCQPGTKVLEIFHPGFVQDCYWQIAGSLGLAYYCLLGESEGIDLWKRYPFDDITLNSLKLDQALREMKL